MRRSSDSVARPVLAFALLGVLALTLVAASGLFVIQRLADEQALDQARQLTELSARLVERRIDEGLVTGDAESLAAVTSLVFDAIRRDPIVRVKIWSADGEIIYSDEPALIGKRYELGADDRAVLDEGGVVAEVSDLKAPENRYERGFGQLMEVYTRVETPAGTPLLFETYQLRSSIVRDGRALAETFTPVLGGHLDRPRSAPRPARVGARAPGPSDAERAGAPVVARHPFDRPRATTYRGRSPRRTGAGALRIVLAALGGG